MFYYFDVTNYEGITSRNIIQHLDNDSFLSFPATEDNPNMIRYLAWLAEGNSPEEWNPE